MKLPTPPAVINLADIQAEYKALIETEADKIKRQTEKVQAACAKIEDDILKTMDDWYYGNS